MNDPGSAICVAKYRYKCIEQEEARGKKTYIRGGVVKGGKVTFALTDPGPNPVKKFKHKILLYVGILQITELKKGHFTDVTLNCVNRIRSKCPGLTF